MTTTISSEHVLTIEQEMLVRAPIADTFAAVLEELGPGNESPDGRPLSMVLEPRPGGRWFRDLGDDNGHLWGHVQAIKRPTLVEITGPLFLSGAAVNNVQYRLSETDGGTRIVFRHSAFGVLPEELRDGMPRGWEHLLTRIQARAEGRRAPGH
jgi:uncharacterized protein YndB with AHSA1/START domain